MEFVTSADGTRIAFSRVGTGPPLVVVPGAMADHSLWVSTAAHLSAIATVLVMDRRGRGESGDTDPYAPEREVEDVLAVLGAAGEGADLLGHSSGGVLAFAAAQRAHGLSHLLLYEPALFRMGRPVSGDRATRLRELLALGDPAAVVEAFVLDRQPGPAGVADLAEVRSIGLFEQAVHLAHTLPYDVDVVNAYTFEADEFRAVTLPVLLIVGGSSRPATREGTVLLASYFPNVVTTELPREGHRAMITAADALADAIARFLTGTSTT